MDFSKLKIGLALGGGGAKGFAHIGILRVFEEVGIKPSAIIGTSAGAIIGAGYCLGYSLDSMIELADKISKKKFGNFTRLRLFAESIISDMAFNRFLKSAFGENTFNDCKIPFKAISVDLESGVEVIIESGLLWEAVRASSAVPFIFSPYFINGQYMVDGGLINNVPVDRLKSFPDLDFTIGIELGGMTSKQYISGMIWEKYYRKPVTFKPYPGWITRMKMNTSLMTHILFRSIDIMTEHSLKQKYETSKPDMIIKPNMNNLSLMDYNKYGEAIEIGYTAAKRCLPELINLLNQRLNVKTS